MENNYNYNYNAPATQFNPQPQPQQPATLGDKKNLVFIGAAVVAIIAVIAIIAGIAGNGYKKPIKNLVKGFEEGDTDLIVEAYLPAFYDAYDEAYGGYVDMEKLFEEELDNEIEAMEDECGKDYKIEIEYKDKEKYSKDEIEDFVDDMKDDYGLEYDADDIKKLYEVDVEIIAEGDDGDYDVLDGKIYVAKVDGEWGIINVE